MDRFKNIFAVSLSNLSLFGKFWHVMYFNEFPIVYVIHSSYNQTHAISSFRLPCLLLRGRTVERTCRLLLSRGLSREDEILI